MQDESQVSSARMTEDAELLLHELAQTKRKLSEAQNIIRAFRPGVGDALRVSGGDAWFGTDINLTGQSETQEELREREAKMDAIVSSAMDAIISINEQQRVIVFNRAAEEVFQCRASEVMGSSIDRFLPALQRETHRERIREFGTTGATSRSMQSPGVLTAVRTNGEEFPIEATISQTQVDGGKIYTVILRDISKRTRAEEALRNSEAILIESERLIQQGKQLRALTGKLQIVREEERTRVARDLHDDIGQILTAVKMELAWIGKRMKGDDSQARDRLVAAMQLVSDGVSTVRKICAGLRPSILDDMGLAAAIEWQANEFSSRTGIACRVSVSESGRSLTSDLVTATFRILQECLTNVSRHADASSVNVTFREDGEILVMVVQDDGKGFSGAASSSSLGILGMNERAKACGGELLIETSAGSGTTITLRIPIGSVLQVYGFGGTLSSESSTAFL